MNNTILVYKLTKEQIEEIEKICKKEIQEKIHIKEAEIYQDIIAVPCFICFINIDKDENEKNIKEWVEENKYGNLNIIINKETFKDEKALKNIIIENYYDNKNRKNCEQEISSKNGIIGFAIGDALGVPGEFKSREYLRKNPIANMRDDSTYNVPKGTWSDDTSMTLATIDSILETGKIDTTDIANKFLQWFREAKYTATGIVFDIGRTTMQALAKYELKIEEAKNCGETGIMDNGNGSLMRMIPITYYLFKHIGKLDEKEIYKIVKDVSSITHANEISIMGCYLYVIFALMLLNGYRKQIAYEMLKTIDISFFSKETQKLYDRILKQNITQLEEDEIKSSGYIVDTLEACIWSFMKSRNYNEAVIKAVNLGEDTDTVGACTGGLAGVYYGIDSIDEEWKKDLQRYDYILELCDKFDEFLNLKESN